jgi:anti-anti-sigma factor
MDLSIISLEGEFDLSQRTRLKDVFTSAICSPGVIVDFTYAYYIDSTVIACLVELQRASLEHQGRLMLAGLNASHRWVFEVTGMSSAFDSVPTTEEAVKSLVPTGAETEHIILEAD